MPRKSTAPASKPPKFHEDPAAQKAAKLKAIEHANADCRRLQLEWGASKVQAKFCRGVYQDACDALHNLIADVPQGELFAQASKELTGDE